MRDDRLTAAGLRLADLAELPGSDARKVVIARSIWESTTMNMKWIAANLVMRSAANAS